MRWFVVVAASLITIILIMTMLEDFMPGYYSSRPPRPCEYVNLVLSFHSLDVISTQNKFYQLERQVTHNNPATKHPGCLPVWLVVVLVRFQ